MFWELAAGQGTTRRRHIWNTPDSRQAAMEITVQ